jgi:hypothetical protein
MVSAKYDTPGYVDIVSVVAEHITCIGKTGRHRHVKTHVIRKCNSTIEDFVPTKGNKGGNNRQLQTTLKRAHGIELKTGQVNNIIRLKKNDTGVHLAQYRLLESLFVHLHKNDRGGTYHLAFDMTAEGTRRFRSFFISPSAMQANAKHYHHFASVDCAHLTSIVSGRTSQILPGLKLDYCNWIEIRIEILAPAD